MLLLAKIKRDQLDIISVKFLIRFELRLVCFVNNPQKLFPCQLSLEIREINSLIHLAQLMYLLHVQASLKQLLNEVQIGSL